MRWYMKSLRPCDITIKRFITKENLSGRASKSVDVSTPVQWSECHLRQNGTTPT